MYQSVNLNRKIKIKIKRRAAGGRKVNLYYHSD
jgi:hypothetical protein